MSLIEKLFSYGIITTSDEHACGLINMLLWKQIPFTVSYEINGEITIIDTRQDFK